jgi:drug/metabolite transporter (DMT)-like permease
LDQPRHDIRRAVAFAVAAIFAFTAMGAVVKWVGNGYAATQVTFFRAFFALLTMTPILLIQVGPSGFRTARPWGFALRGFIGVFGTTFCFYGMANLPLADSVAIAFTMPLWVTVLSWPVLGEPVGAGRWVAVIAGFAGVLVIVPPTGDAPLIPAVVSLAGNGLVGLTLVLMRGLNATERPQTIVFYYMVALTIGTAALLPLDWRTPAAPGDWTALIATGVIAALAHTLLTHAYRHAPAVVVASLDYTGILWGVLFGYVIWDERPGANLFIGAVIVIGCGLYVLLSEERHGRVKDAVGGNRPSGTAD